MNFKKSKTLHAVLLLIMLFATLSCNSNEVEMDVSGTVVKVQSNFISDALAEPISIVSRTLCNGFTVECYKIVAKGIPADHNMGRGVNINDNSNTGEIWLENGNVYDLDGAFVKNLATFYSDKTWMLYNATTSQAAANPNIGA